MHVLLIIGMEKNQSKSYEENNWKIILLLVNLFNIILMAIPLGDLYLLLKTPMVYLATIIDVHNWDEGINNRVQSGE